MLGVLCCIKLSWVHSCWGLRTQSCCLSGRDDDGFCVPVWLKAGANLEMFDEEHRTPLMAACENNHLDTVKYLVRAGATVGHKVGHWAPTYRLPDIFIFCVLVLHSASLVYLFWTLLFFQLMLMCIWIQYSTELLVCTVCLMDNYSLEKSPS